MPDQKLTVSTPNQRVCVTINYDNSTGTPAVVVTPSIIALEPECGCIIEFKREGDMPGIMKVTFSDWRFVYTDNPEFARTGVFIENDGDVRIDPPPAFLGTKYVCELVDDRRVVARSKEITGGIGGGAVEPVKRV